mgnify:CR=1 FL=1
MVSSRNASCASASPYCPSISCARHAGRDAAARAGDTDAMLIAQRALGLSLDEIAAVMKPA